MPELPEVETVARGLRAQLRGRRFTAVHLYRRSVYRGPALQQLIGAAVGTVARAGKFLVLNLDGDRPWQLLFHLGMTGQLLLQPPEAPLAKHTHARFDFDGPDPNERLTLTFRDPRRFGRIGLAPTPPQGGFAPALHIPTGAEPLEIGETEFASLLHRRQAPIKNALLNQKLLRGLGNIYADESLFRAGIDPRAHALSRPRLRRLRHVIRAVLEEAIAAGGSSISDYVDSNGAPGWFHLQHRVYGRTGEPCLHCGRPIRRLVLAGRSAHFCPVCQHR